MDYLTVKTFIIHLTHLSGDALHIHVGLLPIVLAGLMPNPRYWLPRAFLLVLVAAVGNEVIDLSTKGLSSWPGSVKDLANTLLWPVLVYGLAFRLLRMAPQALSDTEVADLSVDDGRIGAQE